MLDILTKPIVIGSISIPLLILIAVILVLAAAIVLSYSYILESKKREAEHKATQKKNFKEDVNREKEYKKSILKLKRSIPYLNKREASSKFIKIIRSFFKDLLELNYEFTFEELAKELEEKGRHKGLISFSEKISDLKYKKGDISKKELLKLCKEFEDILNYEAIPEVEKIEKKGILEKLRKSSVSHVGKPPVDNKKKNSKNSEKS